MAVEVSGKDFRLAMSGDATRRFGWVFSGQALVFIQSMLFVPLVIKVSGEETYGAYLLSLSYMGLVFALSSFGVSYNCRRWLPNAKSTADRASVFLPQFWFQLCSVGLLGALGAVLYVNVVSPVVETSSPTIWLIPLYLMGLSLYSQSADYYRDTHRTVVFTFATVAPSYLSIAICLTAYLGGHALDLDLLLGSLTFASAVIGGLLFAGITREIGFSLSFPSAVDFHKAARFGLPMVGTGMVEALLAASDKFIIGLVLSVRDVGIYVPAFILGSLIMVLPRVLAAVLVPMLSREAQVKPEHGGHLLKQAAQAYLLIAIPYAAGTALFGHDMLKIFTNDRIADAAYPAVTLVACSAMLNGLVMMRSSVLFVRLSTTLILKLNIAMAVASMLLNLILLNWTGQVWTSGLAALGGALVGYWYAARALRDDPINFHLPLAWLLKVLALSGVMLLAAVALRAWWPWPPSHFAWVWQVGFSVVIYLLGLGLWAWLSSKPSSALQSSAMTISKGEL
jgi:O-antigen/teichoic acid export membrane protein